MNFAELNSEFITLRHLLRLFVSENALEEISVQSPQSEDEAGFLRLIAWSYVLLFESGRISIPILMKIPVDEMVPIDQLETARDLVHVLRTWSSHNLSFSDEREREILKRSASWFIKISGSNPPNSGQGWRDCYEFLCCEVFSIIKHCRHSLEIALSEQDDGARTIEYMKLRLDRNWSAYEFEAVVQDVATRIGQNLNASKFTRPRLGAWRKFLEAIPESDDPRSQIVRLIERDVLDHFESVLPIDGNDVMRTLNLAPGGVVGDALIEARHLFRSGITKRDQLLSELVRWADETKGG